MIGKLAVRPTAVPLVARSLLRFPPCGEPLFCGELLFPLGVGGEAGLWMSPPPLHGSSPGGAPPLGPLGLAGCALVVFDKQLEI